MESVAACGLFSLSNRGTLRDRKPLGFQDLSLLGKVGGHQLQAAAGPKGYSPGKTQSSLYPWYLGRLQTCQVRDQPARGTGALSSLLLPWPRWGGRAPWPGSLETSPVLGKVLNSLGPEFLWPI